MDLKTKKDRGRSVYDDRRVRELPFNIAVGNREPKVHCKHHKLGHE